MTKLFKRNLLNGEGGFVLENLVLGARAGRGLRKMGNKGIVRVEPLLAMDF